MAKSFEIRADLCSLLNLGKHTHFGTGANHATICQTQKTAVLLSRQRLNIGTIGYQFQRPLYFFRAWSSTKPRGANSDAFTTFLAMVFEHAPAMHKRQFSEPVVLQARTLLQFSFAGNSAST